MERKNRKKPDKFSKAATLGTSIAALVLKIIEMFQKKGGTN